MQAYTGRVYFLSTPTQALVVFGCTIAVGNPTRSCLLAHVSIFFLLSKCFRLLSAIKSSKSASIRPKKNLTVSIPTLRWRERIEQNRDGIVLFCRCAVRARIYVVELVSLVPYQIVHHNVCLTYNLLYTSYFTQLTLSCP